MGFAAGTAADTAAGAAAAAAFTFFGFSWRGASVGSIAGVEFDFQSFEFSLSVTFILFVAISQALVEGVELGGAI